MAERQYWDANCFLAIINDEAERVLHLRPLWESARSSPDTVILTSAVTIAECPNSKGTPESHAEIDAFLLDPRVRMISADRLVGQEARDLQRRVYAEFRRTLPVRDAIHLASALRADADRLLTYDKDDLIPLSNRLTTRGGKLLAIEEPRWSGSLRLPLPD